MHLHICAILAVLNLVIAGLVKVGDIEFLNKIYKDNVTVTILMQGWVNA